jgi:hypothetical protein
MGDGVFYGKNPQYGAAFSYYLAHDVKDPGELTILNAQGQVVRTLKGTHLLEPGEQAPQQDDLPPAVGTKPEPGQQHAQQKANKPKRVPWVPTQTGLQRIFWNLRANGPVRWNDGKDFEKGPTSGALLPPGDYTAKLTIGGQTMTRKFTVVNDPASDGTLAGMEDRYQVTEAVLHEVSRLDVALNRLDDMRAQLKALRGATKDTPEEKAAAIAIDALQKQMKAVEAQITSNPGAAESTLRVPDQIREHLLALDGGLEGADDAPTPAMLAQKKLLQPEYESAIRNFDDFLSRDVAAFNRTMSKLGLSGVVLGSPLQP